MNRYLAEDQRKRFVHHDPADGDEALFRQRRSPHGQGSQGIGALVRG